MVIALWFPLAAAGLDDGLVQGTTVGVTDCDCQRVGGILLGDFWEVQQSFDHLLNLMLSGVAVANDSAFNLQGRIFTDREFCVDASQHGGTAGMSQGQRRSRILGQKYLFDTHFDWLVGFNDLLEPVINRLQTVRQRVTAAGRDNAVIDVQQPIAFDINDAVAGNPCAWVNAENSQ